MGTPSTGLCSCSLSSFPPAVGFVRYFVCVLLIYLFCQQKCHNIPFKFGKVGSDWGCSSSSKNSGEGVRAQPYFLPESVPIPCSEVLPTSSRCSSCSAGSQIPEQSHKPSLRSPFCAKPSLPSPNSPSRLFLSHREFTKLSLKRRKWQFPWKSSDAGTSLALSLSTLNASRAEGSTWESSTANSEAAHFNSSWVLRGIPNELCTLCY